MKTLSIKKIKKSCDDVSAMLKSMAHPQRLIILGYLASGEKTVSELVENCEISQSRISQYLIRMKMDGLLECERVGKYQYYKIADERLIELILVLQKKFCV
jgi:DNA-binding transcriptional ArsR family regulator